MCVYVSFVCVPKNVWLICAMYVRRNNVCMHKEFQSMQWQNAQEIDDICRGMQIVRYHVISGKILLNSHALQKHPIHLYIGKQKTHTHTPMSRRINCSALWLIALHRMVSFVSSWMPKKTWGALIRISTFLPIPRLPLPFTCNLCFMHLVRNWFLPFWRGNLIEMSIAIVITNIGWLETPGKMCNTETITFRWDQWLVDAARKWLCVCYDVVIPWENVSYCEWKIHR